MAIAAYNVVVYNFSIISIVFFFFFIDKRILFVEKIAIVRWNIFDYQDIAVYHF